MAYSGAWRAANTTPLEYDGATRWGTGVNPVHAIPEGIPRGGTKLPLGSTGPGGVAPEIILGPVQWGYQAEDSQFYAGEDYRYLEADHPNWGDNSTGRPDRDGQIMEAGAYPQPEGWPAWGPANITDPEFPLSGPPGGAGVRAYSDQLEIERGRLINVPTPGVTGGWLNKAHGAVNTPRTSDPKQYEINTGLAQTSSALNNDRAVARGTDDRRVPIHNRLTGVKVKSYAKDINMGGGPGTPDMFPQQQDRIPKRPFFYRAGAVPPAEAHTWNSISYWDPIQRVIPDDAGSTVTALSTGGQGAPDYGYSSEDGGYY
jgi:hypothetical protein